MIARGFGRIINITGRDFESHGPGQGPRPAPGPGPPPQFTARRCPAAPRSP
jgi:hypothetical protein